MELTNKIQTLTIGEDVDHCTTFREDVYEQTLALFNVVPSSEKPPRTPNYDNRAGLKDRWVHKEEYGPQKSGWDIGNKPVGVQRQNVQLDLQKSTRRGIVGSGKSSRLLHGPLPARTVCGLSPRGRTSTPCAEMVQAQGGSQRIREKQKNWRYSAERRQWVHIEETKAE